MSEFCKDCPKLTGTLQKPEAEMTASELKDLYERQKNPYYVKITPENWGDNISLLERLFIFGIIAYLWWVGVTAP